MLIYLFTCVDFAPLTTGACITDIDCKCMPVKQVPKSLCSLSFKKWFYLSNFFPSRIYERVAFFFLRVCVFLLWVIKSFSCHFATRSVVTLSYTNNKTDFCIVLFFKENKMILTLYLDLQKGFFSLFIFFLSSPRTPLNPPHKAALSGQYVNNVPSRLHWSYFNVVPSSEIPTVSTHAS